MRFKRVFSFLCAFAGLLAAGGLTAEADSARAAEAEPALHESSQKLAALSSGAAKIHIAASRRPAAYRTKKSLRAGRKPKKETKHISKEAYVTAGALALIPGLGAGHAILGRYRQNGWIFTASEAAAFAMLIFAYRLQFNEEGQASRWGQAAAIIMQTAFVGLKIWEAADVWNLPPHYKVVPNVPDISRIQIQPAESGLALSYRF